MSIELKDISWSFGDMVVLRDVSLSVAEGEVVGLVGPNGSGKSSLLRIAAGLRPPRSGSVCIDAVPVASMPRRRLAQLMSFLEQESHTPLDLRVMDVVLLGRIPHRPSWAKVTEEDRSIARNTVEAVGVQHLADRRWTQLSGGERQRVQLARALAQQPKYLVLDEPTNHLDIRHQLEFLSLVRRSGATALISLHDLNLAASYCDRVAVLHQGGISHVGPPRESMTPATIEAVYRVRCEQVRSSLDGGLRLLFGENIAPPSNEP